MTLVRRSWAFANMSRGETASVDAVGVPLSATRDWALGGSTGSGVSVCVVDSGIDGDHPLAAPLTASFAIATGDNDFAVVPDSATDVAGHGTACASIIHTQAPDVALTSLRLLGPGLSASGRSLLVALTWAIGQGFDLINLSLSSRKPEFKEDLHDLADRAYYSGVIIVASAHNSPVTSFPWSFPSVISVGSHERDESERIEFNPAPPVDFFARGVSVPVVNAAGGSTRVSGNSYATPHVTALCARILAKHPGCSVSRLRAILALIADNVS